MALRVAHKLKLEISVTTKPISWVASFHVVQNYACRYWKPFLVEGKLETIMDLRHRAHVEHYLKDHNTKDLVKTVYI